MESVNNEVIGLGVGDEEVRGYAVGDASVVELLDRFTTFQSDTPRIAHSATSDLNALGVSELIQFYPLFDTMVAAHLFGEYPSLSLQNLAASINVNISSFDDITKLHKCKDLSGVPEKEIAAYNLSQIRATTLLYRTFSERISSDKTLKKVYDLEMAILPLLAKMEEAGIAVDRKKLIALGHRFQAEGAALEEAVAELTSGHIQNVNSPLQVKNYIFGQGEGQLGARIIYKSKRTGEASTSERVLKKLIAKDPVKYAFCRVVLRAREIKKNVNTYCFGIANRLDSASRSHTELSQVTTETGRLASKNPNHQNIPKRRPEGLEIRRCMIAPPHHSLIACDMDQLELRIIAEESGERKMIDSFLTGEDIHMKTALEMFGDPSKRFPAKVLNYTIVYLAGAQQIADQVGRTKAVAEMWQQKYFRTYQTLKQWIDEWADLCSKQGYVETWYGRRRDVTRYFNMNYEEGKRKAVNTRIQGTAAEVLKLAMLRVDEALVRGGLKTRVLMQIHDELLFEVPDDEVDQMKVLLKETMTTMYKNMPLPCTVKVGPNWADVH